MKKIIRLPLAVFLAALTLFLLASCLFAPRYSVTFVVEGQQTSVKCGEGKIPTFRGTPERAPDAEYRYVFAGWDPPLAAASADALYTARFVRYKRATCEVTFLVDGYTLKGCFDKGTVPDFEAVVLPDEWSERYLVTAWDKEPAEVTEDTTYTAVAFEKVPRETVEVVWTADTVYYDEVPYGSLPKPPEVERWSSAKYEFVLKRWNKEILPATSKIFYTAVYEQTVRSYDITFVVGDYSETSTLLYGEMPIYSRGEPVLPGGASTSWDSPIVPVRESTVYTAVAGNYPPFLDDSFFIGATKNPPRISYVPGENPNGSGYFSPATVTLLIALEENRCPGRFDDKLRDIVVNGIRHILYGGVECQMDACCYWSYPIVSGIFTVAKRTPSIWGEFTDEDIERADRMMMSYAVLAAFATDDRNNYSTGPGLHGNYGKDWNPNYRLANVMPILNCLSYFGSSKAVNDILANFDHDEYIAAFRKYGWNNMLATWTASNRKCNAKDLMTSGGSAWYTPDGSTSLSGGGSGVGVKVPGGYQYKGYTLDNPAGIFAHVINYNFSGGKVVTDSSGMANGVFTRAEYEKYQQPQWENTGRRFSEDLIGEPKAMIFKDGDKDPVLGLDGMMLEWVSGDGEGFRSSGSYCGHDLIMVACLLGVNRLTGWWDPDADTATASRIYVGMTDTIYKLEIGCYSFSLGCRYTTLESSYGGYLWCKNAWQSLYGPELRSYAIKD